MNCIVRMAIRTAIALFGVATASGVSAQATYARGELLWTSTFVTAMLNECTSCHNGANQISLAGLRLRLAGLSEAEVQARVNTAMNGGVPQMTGLYTAIISNDRNSLAIYLGNFLASATVAASTALTSLTASAVGQTGTSTLTITNTGPTPLMISAFAFTGPNAAEFTRMNIGLGCVMQTVAANGNCQEQIRFTPTATGIRTATLTISHGRNPNGAPLALSGSASTGAPPSGGAGVSSGGGGAIWPWALLLLAASSLRRRSR